MTLLADPAMLVRPARHGKAPARPRVLPLSVDARFRLVGYWLPVTVTVLVTDTWFRAGRFIAGGDVAPFVRESLAGEWSSLWNHQVTGAGSVSYDSARLLDLLVLRAVGLAGGSPLLAQRALYAACFACAAFGAAYLAAVWVRRPFPVAVAGLLGAFNPFLLVYHPNLLPPLAEGLIGLVAGLLLRAARDRGPCWASVAVASLGVSYLAQNPPLLVLMVVAVLSSAGAARWLVGTGATRHALVQLAKAAPFCLLFNLWWLLPFVLTTLHHDGLQVTAQTDVQAWTWSQARNSLPNVASLNAHWGWVYPDYFPYAHAMDSGVWGWLRWVFPALVLAGALVPPAALRRPAHLLGGTAVVLLFVAKGAHSPLGEVNLWLYAHLPGFWLFREPMSKVGVLLLLVYTSLSAMALDSGQRLLGGRRLAWRACGSAGLAGVAAAAVVYPWPLWTGAVVPNTRGALPGEHVRIPAGWYRVAALLNHANSGKVLVLPLDSYYQVSTTWGYHGVDAVPQQLIRRPVLQELPGGYFDNTAGVNGLLDEVQRSLLGGDAPAAFRTAQSLGATYVVVRRDLLDSDGEPSTADARRMLATLRAGGAKPLLSIGLATVYRLPVDGAAVRLYGRLLDLVDPTSSGAATAVAALPSDTASTVGVGTVGDGVRWDVERPRQRVNFDVAAGRYQVTWSPDQAPVYRAKVHRGVFELVPADQGWLDEHRLAGYPRRTLRLHGAAPVAVSVAGQFWPLDARLPLVTLAAGAALRVEAPAGPSRLLRPPAPLGDCDRSGPMTPPGLRLTRLGPTGFELTARSHSACTWFGLPSAKSLSGYAVALDYRSVRGAPARLCVWEAVARSCAQLPPLLVGAGWRHTAFAVAASARTGPLRIYLYADSDPGVLGRGVTSADYRNLEVQPLRQLRGTLVGGPAPATVEWLAAGRHTLRFAGPRTAANGTAISRLEDCHSIDPREADVAVTQSAGLLQLSARADSGCVWTGLDPSPASRTYQVTVDYRTVSGQPARVCIWEVGPDRCILQPGLVASDGWHHFVAQFVADAGTEQLRLYVYADGQADPPTEVDYRHLGLRPVLPVSITVLQLPTTFRRTSSRVSVIGVHPGRVNVRLNCMAGRVLLVLTESYAPGWQLTGLPRTWRARHLVIDGYANGWLVTGRGNAELALEYAPERAAEAANRASALALAAAALGYPISRRRSRAGRRRRTTLLGRP